MYLWNNLYAIQPRVVSDMILILLDHVQVHLILLERVQVQKILLDLVQLILLHIVKVRLNLFYFPHLNFLRRVANLQFNCEMIEYVKNIKKECEYFQQVLKRRGEISQIKMFYPKKQVIL